MEHNRTTTASANEDSFDVKNNETGDQQSALITVFKQPSPSLSRLISSTKENSFHHRRCSYSDGHSPDLRHASPQYQQLKPSFSPVMATPLRLNPGPSHPSLSALNNQGALDDEVVLIDADEPSTTKDDAPLDLSPSLNRRSTPVVTSRAAKRPIASQDDGNDRKKRVRRLTPKQQASTRRKAKDTSRSTCETESPTWIGTPTVSPNASPSLSSPLSATLTPFQFVTDRVFKSIFSTFSSSAGKTTSHSLQEATDESNGVSSTSSVNPFVPTLSSSPSLLASKLLRKIRDTSRNATEVNGHQNPLESKGFNFLPKKFPNFLSSSSSRLPVFSPSTSSHSIPDLPDLISREVGGKIIFATDEFFAPAENLLNPSEPEWKEDKFTPFGNWYDGWHTRRRRLPGHDWCLIELGIPGLVQGVEVNTRYFAGNTVPSFSIEGAYIPDLTEQVEKALKKNHHPLYQTGSVGVCQSESAIRSIDELLREQTQQEPRQWRDIVEMSQLLATSKDDQMLCKQHFDVVQATNECEQLSVISHIRLNLFPDGGIARLRVFGSGTEKVKVNELTNLASMANGGLALLCNNQFSKDPRNLLLDTIPRNIQGGWLSARNPERAPILECDAVTGMITNLIGQEWVIIRLGSRRTITRLEIDTKCFFGNHPESVEVKGIDLAAVGFDDLHHQREQLIKTLKSDDTSHDVTNNDVTNSDVCPSWSSLLSRTQLMPDANHIWANRPIRSGMTRSNYNQQRESQTAAVPRKRRGSKQPIQPVYDDVTTPGSDGGSVILNDIGPVTHLCMTIYPDGGISRLRVFGKMAVTAGKS